MANDPELTQPEELLFRQIRPDYIDGDVVSSQAFSVMPKDNNKLSVDRSSLTTAKGAYETFVANGCESAAVYGLTVGEFNAEELKCYSLPETSNPAHSYADFSVKTRSGGNKTSKKLRRIASDRGCLYQP